MPLATRINLAPPTRPIGGLLSAAKSIGGEWWRGVTFTGGQCLPPQVVGACPEGDVEKDTHRPSGIHRFVPFNVVEAVECSTLSRANLETYANESLDVVREFAVAGEFLSGLASGNIYLNEATFVGGAPDPVVALACLEQRAATALSGRTVFFHASVELGTHLLAAQAIWRDGRIWRTAAGNVVVISAGYDGRAPAEPSVPISGGDEIHLYATGEVYAEVGQRDVKSYVDRSVNTDQTWAEDLAVVAFDDCYFEAIGTGIDHCDITPPPNGD